MYLRSTDTYKDTRQAGGPFDQAKKKKKEQTKITQKIRYTKSDKFFIFYFFCKLHQNGFHKQDLLLYNML